MDKSNIINREVDINLHDFNKLVLELENILEDESFSQQSCYNEWQSEFERIYGKETMNIHLYAIFIQIFYIAHLFILQYLVKENYKSIKMQSKMLQVRFIQTLILNKFSVDISLLNRYFLPLVEILENNWIYYLEKLNSYTLKYVFEAKIKPEYLFDYLIQQGLKSLLRHSSGEYYTPPFLVKKMVNETYKFGERVLDPSCGTGNFLIEIIKSIISSEKSETDKLKALSNIYGFDINPMSIFLAIL
ncbi:MAG: N-6 DNA methylase, partial [Candidatus Lokiarchaeota archaeon]